MKMISAGFPYRNPRKLRKKEKYNKFLFLSSYQTNFNISLVMGIDPIGCQNHVDYILTSHQSELILKT